MSAVEVLSPDHLIRYPFGSPDASATRSHYDDEEELISTDSTPFVSAPSSPSRSKARDFFYSVPPSPIRSFEGVDSFYESATLPESAQFNWDGDPTSTKGSDSALDPDLWFNSSDFQDLSPQSTPRNPSREQIMGFEFTKDRKAQLRDISGSYEGLEETGQGLDSDFQFSSEFEDGSFVQMSSADELFSKGKILPLMQPHKLQKQSQAYALLDSGTRYSSVSAPSSPSVTLGGGAARAKSRLGLKYSSAEIRNVKEESSKQGWAKAFVKSRLFGKNQKTPPQPMEAATLYSPQQTKMGADFSKRLDLSVNHLRALRVDDAPSQIHGIKGSGTHPSGRDAQQPSSHQRHVAADMLDTSENTAVKKWYDKDGDKRMKNGAARSWPRPSARSVLATRSSRQANSSKQGSLAAPLEMHYRNSVATSEQMRRRTFLPYKQSLLGCLGYGCTWVPGLPPSFDSVGR